MVSMEISYTRYPSISETSGTQGLMSVAQKIFTSAYGSYGLTGVLGSCWAGWCSVRSGEAGKTAGMNCDCAGACAALITVSPMVTDSPGYKTISRMFGLRREGGEFGRWIREGFGMEEAQELAPCTRNAGALPLGNGSNSDLTEASNLGTSAQTLDDLIVVHGLSLVFYTVMVKHTLLIEG